MNTKLAEYALLSLSRQKRKNIFVLIVMTMLVAVCLSIFTISSAMKKEVKYSLDNLPDITVQSITGGRQQYISESLTEKIAMTAGVVSAAPRVWGYYYFEYLNTNLTIVGIDIFDPAMSKTLSGVTDSFDLLKLRNGGMLIGAEFKELIREIYNKDEFSFQQPDGSYLTLQTAGVFHTASSMLSTGTIVMDKQYAAKILGIPDGKAADIAVNSANEQEISTISEKIVNMHPSLRTITKEEITASYQNIFDYKNGLFLFFYISALLTFFMIIYDKLSGLSGQEAREISVLKAVGWRTSDVLKTKLYEAGIIAVTAFTLAVLISLVYVYILQAPGLRSVFMGYSYIKPQFRLVFSFDTLTYITVFFITVPVYAAAVIIPAWKAAVTDSGEVIR